MVKIYYNLILKGLWQIKDVPAPWRDAVQEMLDAEQQTYYAPQGGNK